MMSRIMTLHYTKLAHPISSVVARMVSRTTTHKALCAILNIRRED
jgi:hypothetical protein